MLGELKEYTSGPEQVWYNEGYDAFHAGKNRSSNPYIDDGKALAWDEGWHQSAQWAEYEDQCLINNALENGWTYTRLGSMCARYWHPQLRSRQGEGIQGNFFFTSEATFLQFLKNPTQHPDYYLEDAC